MGCGNRMEKGWMKRFKFNIYRKLIDIARDELAVGIRNIFDIGFLRIDTKKNAVDSIYLYCKYVGNQEGFIKFDVRLDDWIVNSYYVTINNHLEYRYDITGKPICEYLNYNTKDEMIYIKLVDGIAKDEYRIDKSKKVKMAKYLELAKDFVEGDIEEFAYFTKLHGSKIYLNVK